MIDPKSIEDVQEITRKIIFRKKNKVPVEVLFRPMCRRNRDFRVLEIIERVGMLPVQICIIGGSDEFMDGSEIMVGTDIKLPTHYLTKIVRVNPRMAETLPFTVSLGRKIRDRDSSVEKVVSWLKEFK